MTQNNAFSLHSLPHYFFAISLHKLCYSAAFLFSCIYSSVLFSMFWLVLYTALYGMPPGKLIQEIKMSFVLCANLQLIMKATMWLRIASKIQVLTIQVWSCKLTLHLLGRRMSEILSIHNTNTPAGQHFWGYCTFFQLLKFIKPAATSLRGISPNCSLASLWLYEPPPDNSMWFTEYGMLHVPYLLSACILSPSSMLWLRACWLWCLLIRASTRSWWASYSSRLGYILLISASKFGSGRSDRFETSFFLQVGHSLFLMKKRLSISVSGDANKHCSICISKF